MKSRILIIIVMLLILLFSYTAVSKIINFRSFQIEMHNQPLPKSLSSILIYFLPVFELCIVSALLFERSFMIGLIISLVVMLFFTVYAILILSGAFGWVPCSCGGVIRNLTWKQHLFFNLFIDALIIWAMFLHNQIKHFKLIHA